ncbi:MAG: hypothetical protein P4L46_10155 [Fimbriimonas sp.]|nr:hypothetical protein [Fimbriimonas sp.]
MAHQQGLELVTKQVGDRNALLDAFESLVKDLVAARHANCMTPSEVARTADIPLSDVHAIEDFSPGNVSFESICRYAQAVGLSITIIDQSSGEFGS